MPGFPRIDKGEGLVRTHDLLAALWADIGSAYEALEANKVSQYLRRCVVRAIFSYIEAVVECIKVEVRSELRLRRFTAPLSAKEQETLGSTSLFNLWGPPGRFLPLEDNVKRTFRLANKVWGLDFRLALDGQDYRDFRAAKVARNKLTHPRTFYDIEVTDADMSCHTCGMMWVRREFVRLFRAHVDSLTHDLPVDVKTRLFASPSFMESEAPSPGKPTDGERNPEGNPVR